MNTAVNQIWESQTTRQFADVAASITDPRDMQAFLRDVMTEKEIIEISSRLQAAKMLGEGKRYADIIDTTKLSSRTIARISDWMQNGCGGYASALQLVGTHHTHLSPARAE